MQFPAPPSPDESTNCASEVWNQMGNILNDCLTGIADLCNEIQAGIIFVGRSIGQGIVWLFDRAILPFTMTGVNIIGYFLDKILYGSPLLRPYLHDGLLESDIKPEWRLFVRNNTGWDIYENMGEILDNAFGAFGLGIGVLNFLNHLLTSVYKGFLNSYHILGSKGVFGKEKPVDDNRAIVVRGIFNLCSLPILAIPLLISNVLDGVCAFLKNLFISFVYNTARTYNLLGENGVFGPRKQITDTRCIAAQAMYGILSAPFVAVTSTLTNIIDGACAFIKNFFLSFAANTVKSFNLLGDLGVFGPYRKMKDTRNRGVKAIYALLSSPLVIIVTTMTNTLDIALTFCKHFFLSFGYNVARTFNLLGENGVFGARKTVKDKRDLPAQIIYGILSAPFVAVTSMITNILDGVFSFTKNFFISFAVNTVHSFNLLGDLGVFGPYRKMKDKRCKEAKVFYGILSAPLVAVVSTITNTIDIIFSFSKNFALSFGYNVAKTFNLLGENGIFGPRKKIEDERGLPAQIIYGILSAPFVALVSTITNLVDVISTFSKNFALSFAYNVARTCNLLAENGVFGPRKKIEDERGLPAQIIYGILSGPFVAVASTITNLVDGACTIIKNTALSIGYNVVRTFNLLGENGVFGPRKKIEDERGLPAQIIYGILSAPLVALVSTITNLADVISSFTKNFALSFGYNVARTFNLLGDNGVFGARKKIEDERGLPAQIIYGILSGPFVAVASTITNLVDGACTIIKNTALSIGYNVARTFNLLGENGVFGARKNIKDERGLSAQIIYGILSAPFVAVASTITNLVDGACTIIKNIGLSFYRNIRPVFNLLGEYGVMGARRSYEDNRGLPAKIIYGILSAPFVALAGVITNTIDVVGGYFKNYKKTIKKPAILTTGVVGGTLLAIPTFLARKTIKGFYNCAIRPFVDCAKAQPFSPKRMLNGIANVVTCGGFAVIKKIFKVCTSYSSRFGFPHEEKNLERAPLRSNPFLEVQNKFREGIQLASHGEFPEVRDGQGSFRSLMRLFYGMHHKVEDILKTLHDTYLRYAENIKKEYPQLTSPAYNMQSFFQSKEYANAKKSIPLRQGEESYLEKVEVFLRPSL